MYIEFQHVVFQISSVNMYILFHISSFCFMVTYTRDCFAFSNKNWFVCGKDVQYVVSGWGVNKLTIATSNFFCKKRPNTKVKSSKSPYNCLQVSQFVNNVVTVKHDYNRIELNWAILGAFSMKIKLTDRKRKVGLKLHQ